MKTCSTCGTHVRTADCTCPHCGTTAACRVAAPTRATMLLALALAGCAGDDRSDSASAPGDMQALYGDVPTYVDTDGDGYDETVDCDDGDAAIHPEAADTAGDGVDSNCDGNDDT